MEQGQGPTRSRRGGGGAHPETGLGVSWERESPSRGCRRMRAPPVWPARSISSPQAIQKQKGVPRDGCNLGIFEGSSEGKGEKQTRDTTRSSAGQNGLAAATHARARPAGRAGTEVGPRERCCPRKYLPSCARTRFPYLICPRPSPSLYAFWFLVGASWSQPRQ